MRVFWQRGESSVAEVMEAVAESVPLAYTSVLTTVRVLEQKGYVTHRQDGRAYLYTARVAEHEASRSEVRHVLQRFFGNSRESLLVSLLGDGDVSPDELARLKQAIEVMGDDPAGPRPRTSKGRR